MAADSAGRSAGGTCSGARVGAGEIGRLCNIVAVPQQTRMMAAKAAIGKARGIVNKILPFAERLLSE